MNKIRLRDFPVVIVG